MSTQKQRDIDPCHAHIGHCIRTRRLAKKLSQAVLAEHLQLSFQQIQKYETGANRVSAATLYKMSKILETPVEKFFLGLDQSTEDGSTSIDNFDLVGPPSAGNFEGDEKEYQISVRMSLNASEVAEALENMSPEKRAAWLKLLMPLLETS